MDKNNNINQVVDSLLKGVNGVLTSKTVVGSPVRVGDTILIPLSDVTIGAGAGSNNDNDKKDSGMGGFHAKMSPTAVLIVKDGNTKVVNIKEQNNLSKLIDMVPEVVDKFMAKKSGEDMMEDDEAVDKAFPDGTDAKEA